MKYLIVCLVIFLVAWRWRDQRNATRAAKQHHEAAKRAKAVKIEACSHCGLHLPAPDMVQGTRGRYCNNNHRKLAESSS